MKIFPSVNEKVITASIFSTLAGLCVGIIASSKTTDLSFIITTSSTLFAAYLGAKFAFGWQNKQQNAGLVRKEVEAGNKAIFEIVRTYNKFVAIRNQFINPYRGNELRHYFILPATGLDHHKTSIDYDSLTFLVRRNEPDLLNQLSGFELEANSTIDAINHRSQLHFDLIQPAIEDAEKKHGTHLPENLIDAAVGKRNKAMIKMATDTMVECVDNVISLAERHAQQLSTLLEREYKGHTFIKMKVLNKSPSTENARKVPAS